MKTGVITYNLNERGRTFRGVPRNFNVPAIVKHINSGEVQERVNNRDLLGYYGHWPRVKFGMIPSEGGFDGGRTKVIEPALVTTSLTASDDGTVRHEAEFLETETGELSAKMFRSRVGGFSSAINMDDNRFFGFDYVKEPNFTTNRGYALDSVSIDSMSEGDVFDAVMEERAAGWRLLLDSVGERLSAEQDQRQLLEAMLRATQQENQELLSRLATGRGIALDAVEDLVLSGVSASSRDVSGARGFIEECHAFDSIDLEKRPEKATKGNANPAPASNITTHVNVPGLQR